MIHIINHINLERFKRLKKLLVERDSLDRCQAGHILRCPKRLEFIGIRLLLTRKLSIFGEVIIQIHNPTCFAVLDHCAILDPDGTRAETLDLLHRMRHKQNRRSLITKLCHLVDTFHLKTGIPHRQCLINDQNIRLHIDGYRKRQSGKHTAGV